MIKNVSHHWNRGTKTFPDIVKIRRHDFQVLEKSGFTLVELLVVMAILALLIGLMFPALQQARRAAMRAACISNLRQLAIANHAYASGRGHFVAAAEDIRNQNLIRWHGARTSSSQPFDSAGGPLSEYLGYEREVKECPAFRNRAPGFESGCGGYGYNVRGVGSQAYLVGAYAGAGFGMPPEDIADPSATVMFADTAFLQWSAGKSRLTEYSLPRHIFISTT